MQKAFFTSFLSDLDLIGAEYDVLYFGAETCEKLLPSPAELAEALAFASTRNMRFVLVLPYLSDSGLESAMNLVSGLSNFPPAAGIVANDLGIVRSLRKERIHHEIALGRLLAHQQCDPRLSLFAFTEHPAVLSSPGQMNERFLQWLLSQGIHRMELSNTVQGLTLPQERRVSYSLWYPLVPIATTPFCPTLKLLGEQKLMEAAARCDKPCRARKIKLKERTARNELVLLGNTVYYENANLPFLPPAGIDRTVLQFPGG